MRPDADQLAALQAQVQYLSMQVANLEQRLAAFEGRSTAEPAPAPIAPKPQKPERLEARFGVTFINRVGAITLAIGIVFFFKYAVDSRWIGAAGRVALGIIVGLALIGAAERLRKRDQQVFAQGVAGCGVAIVYIALYASFVYYQLFPQWLAFCGMVGASALSVGLTFRYRGPALAAIGVAGALLTPLLLGHTSEHPALLFTYVLLVDLAAAAIALRRRWTTLYVVVFAGTVILFLIWLSSRSAAVDIGTGLLFLCALFAFLFALCLRLAAACKWQGFHAFLPLNAAWTMFSAWILLDRHHPGWFAVFALGLAVTHFITAFSAKNPRLVREWLYILAHACLLSAGLRTLVIWAVNDSAPATRTSVISESTSVLLAIYAIGVIALGVVRRSLLDRTIGLVLLGIVIGKLYCYDVWQLARFYRISAFVALGILLLAASYIYSRFRDKFEALWAGKETETGRRA